jgi:integrase
MARVLTAKSVEAKRPDPAKRLEVPDAAMPGLYLVVQPGGAKSWAFRFRYGGKTRKLTLGRFPALSLSEAREAARRAAQAVELGTDPGATKAKAKAAAREAQGAGRDTVAALVEQFDKRHLSHLRSGRDVRQALDRFVVKAWGDRDVKTITKRDVLDLLDAIVDRGTPTMANRVLAYTRKFMNWCVERDVLERAPTDRVRAPAKETTRDRVLSDDEIRWFWKATEAEGQPFGPLARLLLLTGQRLGEGAGMTDRELKGDVWHLAATRTKNGRPHDVPLSEAARDVLAGVKRVRGPKGFVFTTNGSTPVAGFAWAIKRLRSRAEAVAADERGEAVVIPPWGFHDLRRTCATGLARLGIPIHVVEVVLNHASGKISGVAAIYNRHDYAAERRAALEAWGRYLLNHVGERQVDNVFVLGTK